jgi:predicted glutamine amidotransferase
MCRMYGFLATDNTRLDCSLVAAQNALQTQSDRDQRGIRNADGWGIAHWDLLGPSILKSTQPAFADKQFAQTAAEVSSRSVIAHVRAATVGRVAAENTHPFHHGPWVFAHNGTISAFEHVRTRLSIGAQFAPTGDTDSELAFLWILNRMKDYGLSPEEPSPGLDPLVDLITDAVLDLVRIGIQAGSEERPKLNFILSDGQHLVTSRFGNSLYWTFRRGVRDCAVCGTAHCPTADSSYQAAVVASEPITDEDWMEVPEGTVLGIEPGAHTMRRSLIIPDRHLIA